MRRLLLFLFSIGLLGAGVYVLSICLRHPTIYGMLRIGFGAMFLIALGGFLLWDDFAKHHIGLPRRNP